MERTNKIKFIFDTLGKIKENNLQKNNLIQEYYTDIESLLPNYLYKYLSFSNCTIENLKQQQVCFINPNFFNDPFDSGANLLHAGAKKRKKDIDDFSLKLKILESQNPDVKYINEELDKKGFYACNDYESKHMILRTVYKDSIDKERIMNNLVLSNIKSIADNCYFNTGDTGTNMRLGDITNNVRIFCMSESENNPLMWAHYGKNDSGICLRYSKQNILNYWNTDKERFLFLIPVCYEKNKLLQNYAEINDTAYSLLRYFMIKKQDWCYEKEWRFVKYFPNYSYNPFFKDNIVSALSGSFTLPKDNIDFERFIEPDAIYLGAKFDINNLENSDNSDTADKENYKSQFLQYLTQNKNKIKFLSFNNQELGYYIRSFWE